MPKRFEISAVLDHSVEQVHAALTDENYWRHRLRENPGATSDFATDGGPGTLSVTVTENTDPSKQPKIVRAVVRGPMEMKRTDAWGPLIERRAEGRMTGASTGISVEIEGTSLLHPDDNGGTTLDMRGEVTVNVPVVGGQIEFLVKQMVAKMVERDRNELREWLAQHR